ncbi:hypothetical protein FBR05_03680 [Deltaproteobacteria bacterium PRO3]|nr:hypothetical protein [Deltaproteobacteria bacterium PRO3]
MFYSLKTLVERQIKIISRACLEAEPAYRPLMKLATPELARALSRGFAGLQSGGEVKIAAAGAVAWQEGPLESVSARLRESSPLSAADREGFETFLEEIQFSGKGGWRFPETNPLTLQAIDWSQEIRQGTLQDLARASARQAKSEALSQNARADRLAHLLFLALRSGNISLAMLLFSHLEAATANEITTCLMEKVQKMQDNKRKLAQDIQNQKDDAQGSKNLQKIKLDMEQVNDDISVLQTFIRDVAQNKQASLELANAFISKEHETTMAIVRSFGR